MSEVMIQKKNEGAAPASSDGWHPLDKVKGFFQKHNPFRSREEGSPASSEHKELSFLPAIDIKETEKGYNLSADVPGMKIEDIKVHLDRNCLVIEGHRTTEREERQDNYYYSERSFGSFARSFLLPEQADHDHIKAEMKNGVLSINIPKKG